ncbi:MAG: TetR/AcrR family transcriptional regulator [Acetatifactor sp.]|nr:TetR/AcrR family transcriptional regulator [Acetatifactor sp.]
MNGKFFDLKKEKQDRMINAALKVFALQGYRHASTDEIVREAGISKGLLFHYFTSKLGVYTFVYDYSVRYMILELGARVPAGERDLFAICRAVELSRMQAMKGYPYMQQFLNRCMREDVSEALLATEERRESLAAEYARIQGQIDYDALPAGVDGQKLEQMLTYTIQGLMQQRFQDASFQPEMLYAEIVEYIDMLEHIVKK